MYTISKLFEFEAAHILTDSYSVECQSIHGHSYKFEVIIRNNVLNKDGMVIDFKKLKEIVQKEIVDKFDHKFILRDKHKGVSSCIPGCVFVSYNPTAENMAKDFHSSIAPFIQKECPGAIELSIKLWETRTGCAQYTGGFNEGK